MIADVAVVVLAVALATSVLVVTWLVQRNTELANQLLAARASDATNALKAERSAFDLARTAQALDGETRQEHAAEDALATSQPVPGAGLAPDDVDGRVRRIAAAGSPAAAATAPGADTADHVRPAGGASPSAADLLRPGE